MIRLPLEESRAHQEIPRRAPAQAAASDAAIEIADGSSLIGGGSTPAHRANESATHRQRRHSAAQLERACGKHLLEFP